MKGEKEEELRQGLPLLLKSLISNNLPAHLSLTVQFPLSVPLPLSPVLTHSSAHQTHFQLYISNLHCALSFSGPVHIPGLCSL